MYQEIASFLDHLQGYVPFIEAAISISIITGLFALLLYLIWQIPIRNICNTLSYFTLDKSVIAPRQFYSALLSLLSLLILITTTILSGITTLISGNFFMISLIALLIQCYHIYNLSKEFKNNSDYQEIKRTYHVPDENPIDRKN